MGGAPPDSFSLTTGIRSVLDRANHFKVGVWKVEHKRVTRGRSKPAWSALAVVSLALWAMPLGLPAAAAAPVCAVDLQAPVRGANAVAALGDELPTVAHAAGLSARNLEHNLRTDRTLWVDECGRPYYVEPADSGPSRPEPVSAASADALTLHSRPGSALTLFLDFDGHAVSATAWSAAYGGDFTAEPYSMDSDPAFNDTELSRIESVWRRVAEDYAPFDVDVTTEDPGTAAIDRSSASDGQFGTRVIITGTNTIYSQCSCGGIAVRRGFRHDQWPRVLPARIRLHPGCRIGFEEHRRGGVTRGRAQPGPLPRWNGLEQLLHRPGGLGAHHGGRLLQAPLAVVAR